ncbi:MAG: C45 family autoproteolytic acyltransferase/hydrolase [Candidatus Hodarchaeota archaeon]
MEEVKLEGSYYDMGLQLGGMLKNRLRLPEPKTKQLEFVAESEKEMLQYTPGLLDELQGLADAADLRIKHLNAILLYEPYKIRRFFDTNGFLKHCTCFAVPGGQTENRKPVYARNYDFYMESQEYFTIYRTNPSNKLSSLIFTDHYVGGFGGINETGLACAVTGVPYYNGTFTPGILLNIAIRWILDSFSKVEDAVEFLENVQHCEGNNYYIADQNNTIAKVEGSPIKVFTTYAENEILVATNHYQSKEMQHLQRKITTTIAGSTFSRLEGIKSWYRDQEKPITTHSIKKVLRGHSYGVCDHRPSDKAGTTWSWVAALGTNTVEVCVGFPCKNEYKIVNLKDRDYG